MLSLMTTYRIVDILPIDLKSQKKHIYLLLLLFIILVASKKKILWNYCGRMDVFVVVSFYSNSIYVNNYILDSTEPLPQQARLLLALVLF